jgi:hypothetical protein
MSLQYRTVDPYGNVLEVSHLRDHFDKPTKEPLLAERCVVRVGDNLVAMTTDECPIYTVH